MEEFLDFFKNKKNLVNVLLLGILILAIPLGVSILRQQQILKSRAVADPIVFTGPNVAQKDGVWVAYKPQISLEITSPLGPPGTGGSPSPSGSPLSSASPLPSGTYACTAVYTLDPASPAANSQLKFNVKAQTPNIDCVVVYQDNEFKPTIGCTSTLAGLYDCTADSGAAGPHTLQMRFGVLSAYPGSKCGTDYGRPSDVECNPTTYQAQ